MGTAIATLVLGLSLAATLRLAMQRTIAVRRSGEADWKGLTMLAGLLTLVLLWGVVAARA